MIFHPKEYKEPILFSFRAKNFFGKKKAAIRVEFGEWSDKFPLDVPGSSGVVVCRHEGRTYEVSWFLFVHIPRKLSSPQRSAAFFFCFGLSPKYSAQLTGQVT